MKNVNDTVVYSIGILSLFALSFVVGLIVHDNKLSSDSSNCVEFPVIESTLIGQPINIDGNLWLCVDESIPPAPKYITRCYKSQKCK